MYIRHSQHRAVHAIPATRTKVPNDQPVFNRHTVAEYKMARCRREAELMNQDYSKTKPPISAWALAVFTIAMIGWMYFRSI